MLSTFQDRGFLDGIVWKRVFIGLEEEWGDLKIFRRLIDGERLLEPSEKASEYEKLEI